ncbi:MAG TPA: hypothetical protein VH165_12100 [Kofleriaceae bacterium]|jgi:hypothetical protein|nr:hypothetical protein [Kofleriaceae bacterium]
MRRNQEIHEPGHGSDRQRPSRDRDPEPDAHEPGDGERITRPYPSADRDEDEDDYRTVGHRPNRLPSREAEEEVEVADDDIVDVFDDDIDDEMFDDDLSKMEGPDA